MSTKIRPQPGRMLKWHRQISYWVIGLCCLSGVGWFALQVATDQMPAQLKPWWLAHGVTGLTALVILGAALPQHVIVTWRNGRNRFAGACCLLCLAILAMTAMMLFYAPGTFRSTSFWLHSAAGLLLCLMFPLHVIKGKISKQAALRP